MRACFNTTDFARFPRTCRVSGFMRRLHDVRGCCSSPVLAVDTWYLEWTWVGTLNLSDPLFPKWTGSGNWSFSNVETSVAFTDADDQCNTYAPCQRTTTNSVGTFQGIAQCSGGSPQYWRFDTGTSDGTSDVLTELLGKCCAVSLDPCVDTFSFPAVIPFGGNRWNSGCVNVDPYGDPWGVNGGKWGPFVDNPDPNCATYSFAYDSDTRITFV